MNEIYENSTENALGDLLADSEQKTGRRQREKKFRTIS